MATRIIDNEECKTILGFERYCISESGRIYRTEALNKKEHEMLEEGALFVSESKVHFRVLNGKIRQGYCSLTDANGKLFNLPVAPLVATAFGLVQGIFDRRKKSITFKDGDKKNLHYTNLKIGEKRFSNSKLSKSDVKKIKKLIAMGIPLKHIGVTFGVSEMQINRIKTGENWGNGKRKIKAPKAPFHVEDGKIRKYIAIFNHEAAPPEIKREFTIKRNPDDPTDNLIIGIFRGYKFTLKHKNITRAELNVKKLNEYFFKQKATGTNDAGW